MRIALIGDIHGNLVALDAVLADSERREVDAVVCLGDVAAGGPQPRAAIARLRELRCAVVRGNADEWLLDDGVPAEPEDDRPLQEIVAWSRAQLSESDVGWLSELPLTTAVELEPGTLLCFHGSPRSNRERILPKTPEDELAPMLGGTSASVLAAGHTHVQLLRRYRSSLIVNAGSVGLPLTHGPLAGRGSRTVGFGEYAILDASSDPPGIDMLRVPVDANELARAVESSDMPHGDEWATVLSRRIVRRNAEAGRDGEREDSS